MHLPVKASIGTFFLTPCFENEAGTLCVNLKSEGGTEVIAKLAETSDVFATDMPEQILREMGMDYQSLSKINPRLVYADTPSPAGA